MYFTTRVDGHTNIYAWFASEEEDHRISLTTRLTGIPKRPFEWSRDYVDLPLAMDLLAHRLDGRRPRDNAIGLSKRRRIFWAFSPGRIDQPYFKLRDHDSGELWFVGAENRIIFKD